MKRHTLLKVLVGLGGIGLALGGPVWAASSNAGMTPSQTVTRSAVPPKKVVLHEGTVGPGDTIFGLLSRLGVSTAEVHKLQEATQGLYTLHHIRIGQPYRVTITAQGSLQSFRYDIDAEQRLEVTRQNEVFVGRLAPNVLTRQRLVVGTVRTSLYAALAAHGERGRIIADLTQIFAWDIDFHTDLRAGDHVRLLIEERLRPGKKAQYQRIIAAEFTNQGKRWQVVYYAPAGEPGAYYRPDGRAIRRLSLSAPLEYTRISSPFALQRRHPILKVNRPHFGVDYAAPHGTPVHSVADGVVEWAGVKGACGKMITVRHNDVYATHYLHLGGFASGIHEGQRVSQGQLLGYVGSTGLSTGPHLDFRLTQGDTYLDPQQHHSILAAGVPRTELPAYRTYAQRLLQRFKDPEVVVAQWTTTTP